MIIPNTRLRIHHHWKMKDSLHDETIEDNVQNRNNQCRSYRMSDDLLIKIRFKLRGSINHMES